MRYKVLDGCPVPRPLYPILLQLKRDTGFTLESALRSDAVEKLLARHHKHTQRYLYEHQNDPGFNPANPPGFSTHELKSDGVAYPTPRGHDLPWWCVGLDIDDEHIEAVIRAAARHGWKLFQPYPGGSEYHHLNFRERPARWRLWFNRLFRKPKRRKRRRKHR